MEQNLVEAPILLKTSRLIMKAYLDLMMSRPIFLMFLVLHAKGNLGSWPTIRQLINVFINDSDTLRDLVSFV